MPFKNNLVLEEGERFSCLSKEKNVLRISRNITLGKSGFLFILTVHICGITLFFQTIHWVYHFSIYFYDIFLICLIYCCYCVLNITFSF